MFSHITPLAFVALVALAALDAEAAPKPAEDPVVALKFNKGVVKVRIYQKQAPITAGNFLDLVQRKFYTNIKVHRVVPNFVVQTGDPKGNGTGGFIDPKTNTERRIKLEIVPALKHDAAGVLAMARTQDPNSASSQFYITLAPTPHLDGGYAVFGRVIEGMNVVKSIEIGDVLQSATVVAPAKKPEAPKKPAPATKKK